MLPSGTALANANGTIGSFDPPGGTGSANLLATQARTNSVSYPFQGVASHELRG